MDTQTLLLIAPIVILQLALQIYALYDIWKNGGAKYSTAMWVVIVIVSSLLGSIAYFLIGRKET